MTVAEPPFHAGCESARAERHDLHDRSRLGVESANVVVIVQEPGDIILEPAVLAEVLRIRGKRQDHTIVARADRLQQRLDSFIQPRIRLGLQVGAAYQQAKRHPEHAF